MKKISTRRGDIWIANLCWGEGNVLRGQHPVIIVSSDQTNRGSGIVTVVPLTSSAKPPMRCHVPVSGFGLRKESVALAEQLTTVSKARLCFRVGTLMHSEKMAELEQAIRHQLEVA